MKHISLNDRSSYFLHVITSTHLISLLFLLSKRLIRNFALIGHSHAGKSSLAEWMLFDESIQKQMPTPGASSLDSDPVEASRHSSLFSHFMRIPHKKHLLEGKLLQISYLCICKIFFSSNIYFCN